MIEPDPSETPEERHMAIRIHSRSGRQYLGNDNKMEVHDLYNEKTQCQIDEIIANNEAVGFDPDTLDQAHREGYDDGAYCLGGGD
jgi:fido (protein-threonine AMPylation protein)